MTTVKIKIPAPLCRVEIGSPTQKASVLQKNAMSAEMRQQCQHINALCAALKNALEQMENLRQQFILSHRQHIARLSVQIAEKILAKEIDAGRYDIEAILTNALQSAPPAQKFVIRLNPNDLKTLQSQQAQSELALPPQTEFLPDWSVRPAECAIETDVGSVDYIIQDALKQIEQTLSSL